MANIRYMTHYNLDHHDLYGIIESDADDLYADLCDEARSNPAGGHRHEVVQRWLEGDEVYHLAAYELNDDEANTLAAHDEDAADLAEEILTRQPTETVTFFVVQV